MLRLGIEQQFSDLRDISSRVTEYLMNDGYIENYGQDGDFSVNNVLQTCYQLLMDELNETYGVHFMGEISDWVGDWYTAYHVYIVRYILSEQYLITWLSSHPNDRDVLDHYLQDANDDTNVNFLPLWFEHLSNTYPEDTYFSELPYIEGKVSNTSELVLYLIKILTMVDQTSTFDMNNIDAVKDYIAKIDAGRKLVVEVSRYIFQHASPQVKQFLDYSIIQPMLDIYDLDKVSAEDIQTYAALDRDSINEHLTDYKDYVLRVHHERADHHIEYWLKRSINPTPSHALVLAAHYFEPDASPDDVTKGINELLDAGAAIFDERTKNFIVNTFVPLGREYVANMHNARGETWSSQE